MLNVVVIGAGAMGGVHCESYHAMDHVNLAGIVDIQMEKTSLLASKLNTRAFATLEEAMEALEVIDVVDVCLPTYLHKLYVLKAAAAGKHVICEKPLAGNLVDAREMIDFCKLQNVKLFVGHVLRFFPEYKAAKAIIDKGTIGKAAIARMTRSGTFPQGWNNWYADYAKSSGLILDLIIHDFDFLRWCFGDVERIYAKGTMGRGREPLDYALVTLRFAKGVIAHVEGSWSHETFSMNFEIAGTTGVINYDSAKDKPLLKVSREKMAGVAGVAVPESPLKEGPYYLELKHFIACIEENKEPLVTVEDAYKAMEIALTAIESIRSGQAIELTS